MNSLGEFAVDNESDSEEKELQLIDLNSYPVSDVLEILLQDKTTKKNIIWATDAYQSYGKNCSDTSRIIPDVFQMSNKVVLRPRTEKALE